MLNKKGMVFMKKNKINKLDLIFLVGIGLASIISIIIDMFYTEYFPVVSIYSIFYVDYPLWFVLLIYSLKYKEKQDKPAVVKWYMCFFIPFLAVAFMLVGIIGVSLVMNLFKLY